MKKVPTAIGALKKYEDEEEKINKFEEIAEWF